MTYDINKLLNDNFVSWPRAFQLGKIVTTSHIPHILRKQWYGQLCQIEPHHPRITFIRKKKQTSGIDKLVAKEQCMKIAEIKVGSQYQYSVLTRDGYLPFLLLLMLKRIII
jgi:hypothetical protein